MTNSISHRGPDANGHYFNEELKIGLGHNRLSILDLSESANQPMTSACGRYIIIYNGEVYNYKEIAQKLVGVNWKTSSDTEVILEGFAKWGVDFVHELNGMFAIAIYDKKNNQLFLFRDRLGIKPLYYYKEHDDFVFASELKAFKGLDLKLTINKSAINNFLYLGFIPQEQTIYQQCFKLPAGSYAIVQNNNIELKGYWSLENQIEAKTTQDYSAAKNELSSLLFSSIENRLISDVPIGTFLSGGTDSSLVTAIASKVSMGKINSFSIGFKERKFNESHYAKKIANHLGTNHNEFIVSQGDAQEVLEKVIDNYDQPFADSSAIPTHLVSKLTKQEATVALSGDGGDELFMGYGSYIWNKRLSNKIIWKSRKAIALLFSQLGNNRYERAAMVFNCPSKKRLQSHIFSQEQYLFNETELKKLLISNYYSGLQFEELNPANPKRKLKSTEEQALFDLQNYLKDDLLVKVDMASMLSSLEVRVPLLDHRIVKAAINVNVNLKSKNGVQKYILKEILHDFVPQELTNHPKWGFAIPLSKWLKTDMRFLIDTYLSKEIITKHQVVNPQYVEYLLNSFWGGKDFLYNRLWVLIVLHKWLEKNTP